MSISVIRNEEGSETRSRKLNSTTGTASWPVTTREVSFLVIGAHSKAEAFSAVLDASPTSEDGLLRENIRFDGFAGDGAMEFSVVYEELDSDSGSSGESDGDDPQMSFDCSGGTAHVVHAISQRKCVLDDGAPDPGCMIGWNGDIANSEFAGVDIVTPQMRESYTRRMRPSALSTEFKRTIAELTGCVNSSKFKGWERGEVLFAGASFSGSSSGSDLVTVTYNFMIQRNESNATIGTLVLGDKLGWEYIWTITENRQTGKSVEVVLKQVCIAQVYPFGNFNKLGL